MEPIAQHVWSVALRITLESSSAVLRPVSESSRIRVVFTRLARSLWNIVAKIFWYIFFCFYSRFEFVLCLPNSKARPNSIALSIKFSSVFIRCDHINGWYSGSMLMYIWRICLCSSSGVGIILYSACMSEIYSKAGSFSRCFNSFLYSSSLST